MEDDKMSKTENLTVKGVIAEAKRELQQERLKEAKSLIKQKLKEKEKAQLVLNNIDREIEELEIELGQKLNV